MRLTRRELLRSAAAASGAVAAGLVLPGCAPDIDPAPTVDVGPAADGLLTVPLADAPSLARDGGGAIVRAPGEAPILLVRVLGGTWAATAATCTHLGCPLGVDAGGIVCPCHLSRFGMDGVPTHPPAQAPLAVYAADLAPGGQAVRINLLAGDPGFPPVVGGEVHLTFAQFPSLASPGGFVIGKPAGGREPILVMALPAGDFASVEALCTHLGCRVSYNSNAVDVVCPCHGSRFSTEGAVLAGPATRPLRSLPAAAVADGVIVTYAT